MDFTRDLQQYGLRLNVFKTNQNFYNEKKDKKTN